jgi:hypothetical protein
MIMRIFLSISLIFLFFLPIQAQDYFRFKSDFSIKEKMVGEEKGQLITGTVYYDKNVRKVNHDIRFPARERWLNFDTTMYRMVADTFVSKRTTMPFGEFSVYNMILSQQLNDFGMGKGGYDLSSVEDGTGGQTISTWKPIEALKELVGKVVLVQEQKRVTAVAFYSEKDEIKGKFYLKEYQLVEGLPVPGKIFQIFYLPENKEYNRIITFKNVVINQEGEDEKYDYKLPDIR